VAVVDAVVVVADDDAEMRAMVAAMLQGYMGAEVVGAEDGEHALRVLGGVAARVLLLDMQMPVLDGPSTLRALRADPAHRHLPVVAMSAASYEDAARAAGCDDFLRKPFTMDALLAAVRPHLAESA
jgi:CheY-like chemotaxis protein